MKAKSILLDAQHWNICKATDIDWLQQLSEEFLYIDSVVPRVLPQLDADPLCCISDYSGDQKSSLFNTYSYFYFDPDISIKQWSEARLAIRDLILGQARSLSYKGLNDAIKRKALTPMLSVADELDGLLISFAIHKKVKVLTPSKTELSEINEWMSFESRWKKRSLSKMIKIAILFAFGVSGLNKERASVTWMTDNDDFTANRSQQDDLYKVALSAIDKFSLELPTSLTVETKTNTTLMPDNAKDLLAIPDLVAGMLSQVLSSDYLKVGVPSLASEFNFQGLSNLKDQATDILSWHTSNNGNLKKVAVVLYPAKSPRRGIDIRLFPAYQWNTPFCRLNNHDQITKLYAARHCGAE